MIQVVSAYLLIQRGEVTDDDPTHQKIEYVPKSRFKRWLYEDPLRYEKHLFVGFGGSSTLYGNKTYHLPTIWHDKYTERVRITARADSSEEYTTLDGESSLRELDYRTWGLISNSTFSQTYIGGYGFSTGADTINNIQYYENRTTTQFPVHETVDISRNGSGTTPPPEPVEGDYAHGGFAAEYYEIRSTEYEEDEWWAFYSARMVSGVPVFTSYEDGMDYCDKVRAYRENQSSANYQAACDAIDKCINPD